MRRGILRNHAEQRADNTVNNWMGIFDPKGPMRQPG